ncbi:MAG TPA: PilZ domain-containing protein [Gemmataceae bacterium]|jgi:hypothetical protein|nr:PilZ domain-containing protein [Gemmataceae bacterium]
MNAMPQQNERRASVRYPARQVQARLTPGGQQASWQVTVRDIASKGIRLVLGHGLEPGAVLDLRLCRPDRDFACVIPIRVVYVLENPGTRFITGCAFTRELSEDELGGLG